MSITVGWNTVQAVGITREEMDAWAARSHPRAIAAMDEGNFLREIVPLKAQQFDGSEVDFSVDEHPRRDTTVEKLAGLKGPAPGDRGVLHHGRQQQRHQRRRRGSRPCRTSIR
jgi:acetyl-CoA acetyltransferase